MKTKAFFWASLLCTAYVAIATVAQASLITWTINATLDNGAAVDGTFAFNPDLGANQAIISYDIKVGAGSAIFPSPPGVFPAFEFTPSDSHGLGPVSSGDGAFEFLSNTQFPKSGGGSESLVLQFVPNSPLTDLSATLITNSTINLNDGHSNECLNCSPWVCFEGATSGLCGTPVSSAPEPTGVLLLGSGLAGLVLFRRRLGKGWRERPRQSI